MHIAGVTGARKGLIQIHMVFDSRYEMRMMRCRCDDLRRRRGQPGCFATPTFEAFHHDLIRTRFAAGEIQLLAAAAGDQPIGYLYNFVYGDRVYAYQSGFDDRPDGRLEPGLVTHALAIEQAMCTGLVVYDFMAGENRLKASFASHWTEMVWLGVQGPSAVVWLDRGLAQVTSRMRAARRTWLRQYVERLGMAAARRGTVTSGPERWTAAVPGQAPGAEGDMESY
jgi:CelD/BcsL family acetyltransferase involved in cellulose biosynthesis